MSISESSSIPQEDPRDHDLSQIRDALRGLRYGTVSIVVQDGVIVQIERTEKRRVRKPGNSQNSEPCR